MVAIVTGSSVACFGTNRLIHTRALPFCPAYGSDRLIGHEPNVPNHAGRLAMVLVGPAAPCLNLPQPATIPQPFVAGGRVNIERVYRPFQTHFRTRRMRAFATAFAVAPETLVLDVGGYLAIWDLLPVRPSLVMLNLPDATVAEPRPNVAWLHADGRRLPFADRAVDVVYSNSVIEHLSTWTAQQAFAHEITRVGRRYYVQTPNKWFPIEPHLLTPFVQFLPMPLRKALARNFTLWGWIIRPTPAEAHGMVGHIRLLDERELRRLFPDARIERERVLGLTKSLIAIRDQPPTPSPPTA